MKLMKKFSIIIFVAWEWGTRLGWGARLRVYNFFLIKVRKSFSLPMCVCASVFDHHPRNELRNCGEFFSSCQARFWHFFRYSFISGSIPGGGQFKVSFYFVSSFVMKFLLVRRKINDCECGWIRWQMKLRNHQVSLGSPEKHTYKESKTRSIAFWVVNGDIRHVYRFAFELRIR